MPNPTVTVVGSYPRPPKEGGAFTLRKTLQALDRGEVSLEDVKRAQDDLVREVVAEQAAPASSWSRTARSAGWTARPISPAALDGFRIGGLIRYFDNNTYYRQPEVIGQIAREEPVIVPDYRFAAEASRPGEAGHHRPLHAGGAVPGRALPRTAGTGRTWP